MQGEYQTLSDEVRVGNATVVEVVIKEVLQAFIVGSGWQCGVEELRGAEEEEEGQF